MASHEIIKSLVEKLSKRIEDERDKGEEGDEEWTKASIILPLIEGLGWDIATDVGYEKKSDDVEGRLDFILKSKPSIGIEAKGLNMPPPQDLGHPQIMKGMRQSKERGASYFIWTNGDCWQFFSLALKNAPLYQVTLSSAHGDIPDKLRIIEKKPFTDNPEIFDEAIRNNWKTRALSEG